MAEVDMNKLQAFRKQYNDLIGQAIVDGLLQPWQGMDIDIGIGIHGQGGNYKQDGGDYRQDTGGDHEQTGGGSYVQSAKVIA